MTALTRVPVSEVSTSIARHSRMQSSTTVRQRSRWPSASPSLTKSIDQLWFAVLGLGSGRRSTGPIRLRLRRRTARPSAR
jgi:hypothetical protein